MTPMSQKRFEISLPFDLAIPKIELAIRNIGGNIINNNPQKGIFVAEKRASFTSWGEKIKVWVNPTGNGCSVNIISESALALTLVDWGKNANNIVAFESELKRIST